MLADAETQSSIRGKSAAEIVAQVAADRAIRLADDAQSSTLQRLASDLAAAEAVWLKEADRTDEVKAAKEGREVTPEDEAIWSAASDAHWAAVDALTVYRPRTAAELLQKARLLTNEGDTRLRTEEQIGEVYLRDAEAVAQMALDAVLTLPDLRPAWDAAMARFDEARAAYEKIGQEWSDLDDAIIARAPAWNQRPREGDGKLLLRWSNQRQFDENGGRATQHRETFQAWLASEEAELDRLNQMGHANDGVYDRLCDAERALIETPAPDLAAVIFKQRQFGLETDDQKGGYADPAYAAARRDASFVVDAWPVWIHEDVLRLAGVPDPLLTTDHFKPRLWKNRFEAAGGKVSVTPLQYDLKIEMPPKPTEAAALLAELAAPGATEALTRYLVELR